ncbi:hypothetical protein [uncultured Winogradskyella sp.]|uniref:hypothetical protein n=1 Tax=uncultured Winogradskyella sp. TaxID=395353 RepID=UPI0030EDD755|tara:strand:- start:1215 stop:1367 length:153 start_codon:yes stop_codon:yes gene_type:complete
MNNIVKEMFELSEKDVWRKNRKIKWDMYYLYMGFANPRPNKYVKKSKNEE